MQLEVREQHGTAPQSSAPFCFMLERLLSEGDFLRLWERLQSRCFSPRPSRLKSLPQGRAVEVEGGSILLQVGLHSSACALIRPHSLPTHFPCGTRPMCLIAFAWNMHPRWRLVLAGNRDEFHARPSAALARWDDAPVIGGRDLQAGGTWLGVTETGRCCVVTNVRDPRDPQLGVSRGMLATDFLVGGVDATAHARKLLSTASEYRPFNLLTF